MGNTELLKDAHLINGNPKLEPRTDAKCACAYLLRDTAQCRLFRNKTMAAYRSFSCRSGIKQRKEKKNQLALSPSYLGFPLREPCKASLPAHLISCNKNRILCDRDAMSTQLHVQSIPKDAERPRTPNQHPSIRNLEAAALEVNYKFDLHTLGLL